MDHVIDRVIVRDGAVVQYAVWRQALDRALAALDMPSIVVVLGPANDVRMIFLKDLEAGLRERGRAVTFLRAELPEPLAVAASVLFIEDTARMDRAMLESICRAPGRRIVLAGPPTFVLLALPVPLTVVTLESLSPGNAAAPELSSRSNARMAIASGVLGASWLAAGLLWTRAPWAPPEPATSRVAAVQPAVQLPLPPGSPPAPAPSAAAIAPPPVPSASRQPGDVTGAISPAPMPAGDQHRPDIGTMRELPAVPVVTQTEPRSDSEPAPPQLQAGPSPAPRSRRALNVPPPAAAIATPPSESAAPSGSAHHFLPDNAPIRVLVSYPLHSAAARQEAAELVRLLRSDGLAASDSAPAARVSGKAGITYFFAEDRDGIWRVEHDLGEGFGPSRLSPPAPGEPLPRPGTIEVLVPER